MKLQEAYYSESNAIGNWTIIGYNAPGANNKTTNFTYSDPTTYTNNTVESTPSTDIWKAAANVALNDCPSGSYWGVKGSIGSDKKVSFATGLSNDAKCLTLTPNFKNIGTGTYTAAAGN